MEIYKLTYKNGDDIWYIHTEHSDKSLEIIKYHINRIVETSIFESEYLKPMCFGNINCHESMDKNINTYRDLARDINNITDIDEIDNLDNISLEEIHIMCFSSIY